MKTGKEYCVYTHAIDGNVFYVGPDRIENQVLACYPCNKEAGSMAVIEKVKLRESKA